MKKILFSLIIILPMAILWSCGSDSTSAINDNVTFPKEALKPDGVRFDYLMFENDYNAVPKDGKASDYSKEYIYSESAGMSFVLSNERQFGPGVNGIINSPKEGEWYKISFECFKPSKAIKDPAKIKGFVVVSFHRGDSALHYKSYPINDLLKAQNKQFIDKWENLTLWHQVPGNIQAGDRLKIYHWNPQGGNLYIDDFKIETWTTSPLAPAGAVLSHGLLEQNYETPDLKAQTTKETAARGVASCVLSGGAGKVQYGAGYRGTLAEANIQAGDYVKVTFAALKKHKVRRYASAANMVVSLNRGEQQLIWDGLPIDPRIVKDGTQAFGQWVRIETWKQIPEDAQPTDFLKIYPWNSQPNPIYIDDLLIEVWKKPTTAPVN